MCLSPSTFLSPFLLSLFSSCLEAFVVMFTDKCSLYLTSRSLLFATDRNDYRNLCSHVYVFSTYHLGLHNISWWSFLKKYWFSVIAVDFLPITLHLRVRACGISDIMLTCQLATLWGSGLGTTGGTFILKLTNISLIALKFFSIG